MSTLVRIVQLDAPNAELSQNKHYCELREPCSGINSIRTDRGAVCEQSLWPIVKYRQSTWPQFCKPMLKIGAPFSAWVIWFWIWNSCNCDSYYRCVGLVRRWEQGDLSCILDLTLGHVMWMDAWIFRPSLDPPTEFRRAEVQRKGDLHFNDVCRPVIHSYLAHTFKVNRHVYKPKHVLSYDYRTG